MGSASRGIGGATEARQSQVESELAKLHRQIDTAEERFEFLRQRLETITRPDKAPTSELKEKEAERPVVELAERIRCHRNRVSNLVAVIDDLTSRLEI